MQEHKGLVPTSFAHLVIPIGDQILNGASIRALTKRYAAIHAASSLLFERHLLEGKNKLFPLLSSGRDRFLLRVNSIILDKAFRISHGLLRRCEI
jgi:hypothetical protein